MKDRLIAIIQISVGGCARHWAERIADDLIADGWMRPPVKAGDKVYKICTKYAQPFMNEYAVENYGIPVKTIMGHYAIIPFEEIGKTVFLTREEAEKAIQGGEC